MGGILRYLQWFWHRASAVRAGLALCIFSGLMQVACSMSFIYLCKTIIDSATGYTEYYSVPGPDSGPPDYAGVPVATDGACADAVPGWHGFAFYAFLIVSCTLLQILFSSLRQYFRDRNDIMFKSTLRCDLFSRFMNGYYYSGRKGRHTGDILNRMEEDARVVSETVSTAFPGVAVALAQFAAAFVFMLLMDSSLAVLLVVLIPACLVFSKLFLRRLKALTSEIREIDGKSQSYMQESLQHIVLLQTLDGGRNASDKLNSMMKEMYSKVVRRSRISILSRVVAVSSVAIGYVAAFLWCAHGLADGSVSFGMMAAFLQLVNRVQAPASEIMRYLPSFVHASASADRIIEIESETSAEESDRHVVVPYPAGMLVSNVTFSYPDGKRLILKDFSHDFKPGSRTAIVGETGAGKSTLIRLMLALLRPASGSITLYSGVSGFSAAASASTRCNFVYVPQGNNMMSGTIRENLLVADPSATEDEMYRVLGIAAAEFVRDLPDGLDTQCSEYGGGLSEGQVQRISIARSLLRKGSILLFDEFSSALDDETEDRLMRNLTESLPDRTMIFITHRDRVADYCDHVVRLARL